MYTDVRKYTNKLLEKLENGELDWEQVCRECLSEMSEDSVKDMCVTAEFVDVDDEDCQDYLNFSFKSFGIYKCREITYICNIKGDDYGKSETDDED